MSTDYPGAIDTLTNPTTSNTLNNPSHSAQHANANDAIEAIETKVGTGASTATSGTVLRGTGAGTSEWAQVNPSTDLATLTSATLRGLLTDETGTGVAVFGTAPTISNPTITGGGSWAGSPTITTPLVSGGVLEATTFMDTEPTDRDITLPSSHDFLIMEVLEIGATRTFEVPATSSLEILTTSHVIVHAHTSDSVGGLIPSEALNATIGCRAYRSSALTLANTGALKIILDAENFDYGSNYSTTTGTFTAPMTGLYFAVWTSQVSNVDAAGNQYIGYIYKNGAEYARAKGYAGLANNDPSFTVATLVDLTVNDTIEFYASHDSATSPETVSNSSSSTFMSLDFRGA